MSTPQLIRCDDVLAQPWRNGGGLTRELLAWPPAPDWRLRLSVADIQADGPFSRFEGVQRWFVVLDGVGVSLHIAGQPHHLTPASAPLCFSGDAPTECRLIDGPTRDLNLMLRGCAGGLASVVPHQPWPGDTAPCGLFAAAAGQCRVHGRTHAVPPMSLLWFGPSPGPLTFAGDGADRTRAWWIWANLDDSATPGPEAPTTSSTST